MLFMRYDKKITEPFAISVISKSFNSKYAEYIQPKDTDNFDFVSPDGKAAIEVVCVVPQNELKAYEYEKLLKIGKNPSKEKVKQLKADNGGQVVSYYGGSINEIIKSIKDVVATKNVKAKKRNSIKKYKSVDLCVCVQDGSLMDIKTFQYSDFDFSSYVFRNIFFITSARFFRYSVSSGFEEYQRIV